MSDGSLAHALSGIETFADLDDGQIQWLVENGEVVEYADGEIVFEPGSVADSMAAVLEGAIDSPCGTGTAPPRPG